MTSAVDIRPGTEAGSSTSPVAAMTVRVHLAGSIVFLVLGLLLFAVAAATIAWPDLLADSPGGEYLTYGRALPMALNALVFGWLTMGLYAVVYHAMPRLLGTPLAFPGAAAVNGLLMIVLVAIGVGFIGNGESAGGRFLEMPWFVDVGLLFVFLAGAGIVSTTVRRSVTSGLPVPAWYLLAAPWWLFLAYAAGAVPGLAGAPAELQSAFSGNAVIGLWVAAAAIGGGYYLVAREVPDAEFHPRLGRIGFWSLGFAWAWTAGRTLQYGPTADWVETIPVLFTAGLIVAVLTIVADFVWAVRGRTAALSGSLPLQLFAAGMALFVLVPLQMLVQSLRSSSTVVRFTAWDTAFDLLTILGVFTLWTAALVAHIVAAESRRPWTRRYSLAISLPLTAGLLLAMGTQWVAGLQQGYTWLAAAQTGAHDNFGEGFFNTTAPLHGTDVLLVAGLGAAGLGVLALVAGVLRRFLLGGGAAPLEFSWPDEEDSRTVLRGAAFVIALAALSVFALPAMDSDAEPSLLADATRDLGAGEAAAQGRDLYVAEGCWYCHTQQVRAIVTDVGLGPVSVAADYAHDPAGVMGVSRFGPDLMHVGSRSPTDEPAWLAAHLADPRAARPWSTMPAYDHLSGDELMALATYLAGLE